MSKVYELVTQKIIEKLEQGTVPWRKPWTQNLAVNWVSQKPYRGINTMLLDGGEYATYKQITAAGGQVKKGEKSQVIVFWKLLDVTDTGTGKEDKVPLLRYYNVFEVNRQAEGLTSKRPPQEDFNHDPIEEAEKIVKGYPKAPTIGYASGRAYYSPTIDHVNVPPKNDFPIIEEYYSTLLHELVHSSGHKKRLNRDGITDVGATFGSNVYSKEELVAELGAGMLCGVAGIDNSTVDNSAAYIASWLTKLKEDKKLIVNAAAQAQKACDLILDVKFDN